MIEIRCFCLYDENSKLDVLKKETCRATFSPVEKKDAMKMQTLMTGQGYRMDYHVIHSEWHL